MRVGTPVQLSVNVIAVSRGRDTPLFPDSREDSSVGDPPEGRNGRGTTGRT